MKCGFEGCEEKALFSSDFCWGHLENKERYRAQLADMVRRGEDLAGANLKKVVLKNASLEKARFSGADLSQADMSGTHLFDSDLEGAELLGVNLSGCEMANCNLKGADLTKAILINSRFWNADLTNANLTECDMNGADLWNARLFNAKLWHANFSDAKFLSIKSFSAGAKIFDNPRINETGFLSAEESYRDLKKYFLANGVYDDASWAAFKEKAMERLIFKKNMDLNYLPSLLMNILCGYGEKPYRIVLSALLTILSFAFLYASFNTMESSIAPGYILKWGDYIYVSAITFTTVGYGDFIPRPFMSFRLFAACEAFMGVFLTGLFIFTLARKYSAR